MPWGNPGFMLVFKGKNVIINSALFAVAISGEGDRRERKDWAACFAGAKHSVLFVLERSATICREITATAMEGSALHWVL